MSIAEQWQLRQVIHINRGETADILSYTTRKTAKTGYKKNKSSQPPQELAADFY